jgi:hypothetical protein
MDPRPMAEPADVPSEVTQLALGETGPISRVPTLAPAAKIGGKPLLEVSNPQDGEAPTPEVKNESQKEEEADRESEAIIFTASHNASEAGARKELHHTLEHLSNPNPPLEEPSVAKITHDELFSDQMEEDGEDREDASNVGSLDVCLPEASGRHKLPVDIHRLILTRLILLSVT